MQKLMNLWKGLALFAALVCFATVTYGQGSVYQNQVFGPTGSPKGGATITVCNNAGSTLATCPGTNNVNLAQIFSNQTLTLPLANPLTADGLGNFTFYASSGIYFYTVTGAGTTSPGPYIAILYCIPNGSCGFGSQFPWTEFLSSPTPAFTVGNGNVQYSMLITSNVTAVTFPGSPHNGDFLGLHLQEDPTGGRTISTGVFPANVIFPAGFSFNTAPNAHNRLGWTYKSTTNDWQPAMGFVGATSGGGGTNYQTVQGAGSPKAQEPILNFLGPIVVTDNSGNNSTDISIPLNYQTVQNNASSLPVEPKINLVPPLAATDNAANTRTDITCPVAVGVGGSHSSGCVPDPGASGSTTDYLGRDMTYHAGTSAATVKPDPSAAVLYVSGICNGGSACSDGNDGLSLGTAKLTIYNAICSLPGGNCGTQTAGGGTVYVVANSNVLNIVHANPTSGDGIWLMGANDPNFASPPAGWLKSNASGLGLAIIGYSPNATNGPNGHKPRVDIVSGSSSDNNHPAIWLSGWNYATLIQNIYPYADVGQQGRPLVVGECSDHTRTGTCQSTGLVFDNDSFAANTGSSTAGPCADIAGNSFWIWFEHSGCNGNAYFAAGGKRANNAAAWLIDTSYLVTITNSNSADGGILVNPGSFGGSVFVKNFTQEGDFSHAIPPAVRYTSWGTQVDGTLENVNNADPGGGSDCSFENDGAWGAGGPTLIGGLMGNCISGQFYVQNVQTTGAGVTIPNPMLTGLVGTFNKYLVGQSNLARRIVGLMPTLFTNKLSTNIANWQPAAGSSGVSAAAATDPFGGNTAGVITTVSGTQGLSFGTPYPAWGGSNGDWVVGGVWAKNWANQFNGLSFGPCPTNGGGVFSKTLSNNGELSTSATVSDQWDFVWAAGKVSSVTGNNVCMLPTVVSTNNPVFYGPVEYFIPASAMSDDEVAEFVSTMNSVDSNCAVGSICNMTGHPISADNYVMRSSGFTSTYGGGTLTGNRTVTPADASGVNAVIGGALTGTKCLHTVGTTGQVQETAADCGAGGANTVNNAQQFSIGTYVNSGSSNFIGGINAPTAPNSVPQFLISTPSAGVGTQGIFALAGVPVRTSALSTDTVFATDRNSLLLETLGSPGTTLNISSGLFSNGFAFKVGARTLNAAVAVTPSTGTCNGLSACTLLQGQNAVFTLDATNTNLLADVHDPPLVAGSGILITRGDYSETISAPGAVGTTGSPVAGNLAKFSAAATITNGDLSGDCTTSGTLTITCQKVNGTSYPAGGALTTNTVPVVTGVSAVTYETVPNAALTNSSVSFNGVTNSLGAATSDLAAGTGTTHGVMLFEGASAHPTSTALLAANAILAGVSSADPAGASLGDLTVSYTASGAGAVNVMTACPANSMGSGSGKQIWVLPNLANTTTTPTLNVCGGGAQTITRFGTGALVAGDYTTTAWAHFISDGTRWQLVNPQTATGGSSVAWSSITNAGGALTLANAANATTFNQTSNVAWTWDNTTAATNSTGQPSPTLNFTSQYCTVVTTCGSAADTWTQAVLLGSQTSGNGTSELNFSHTGTSGATSVSLGTSGTSAGALKFLNATSGSITLQPPTGALGAQTLNIPSQGGAGTDTLATLGINETFTGRMTFSAAPAASQQAITLNGAVFTGGTGTTTRPLFYMSQGAAPSDFSTNGTEFGFNAGSGFTGNFLDAHVNSGSSVFSVNYQGNGTFAGTLTCSAATCLGSDTATTQAADDNSTKVATTAYVDRTVKRALGWAFGDLATGSALTTSEIGYITVPYACTINGYHIMADAGTVTIKTARVNGGTALPTLGSNSISTSGVSLSSGTKVDSSTVSDFTSTAIAANDTLGFFITAVSTAKQITFQLDCSQ